MSRPHSTALTVVVVAALAAPLVAGGVWVYANASESPLQSAHASAPLTGTIETATRSHETNVSVKVEYADALSPTTQASGTVTAMNASAGTTLDHAQVVMVVDAAEVVGYVAEAPLYRDVTRKSKGTDIETAQQLLIDLGYLDGEADGDAGWYTEQAIKKFNEAHGYGKNNTTLARSALVWLGTAPAEVASASVTLGDTVAPGAELFATTASLSAIAVTEPPTLTAEGELVLDVAGVSVPYEAGSGRVTAPDHAAAIADALKGTQEGVGLTRLAAPVEVASIPAPAVITDDSGATCIYPDAASAPVPIAPLGGTLGTVDVDLAMAGDPILLNPREVLESPTCG